MCYIYTLERNYTINFRHLILTCIMPEWISNSKQTYTLFLHTLKYLHHEKIVSGSSLPPNKVIPEKHSLFRGTPFAYWQGTLGWLCIAPATTTTRRARKIIKRGLFLMIQLAISQHWMRSWLGALHLFHFLWNCFEFKCSFAGLVQDYGRRLASMEHVIARTKLTYAYFIRLVV